LEVWFQRPKDIVRKLLSGDLDLGIVGLDILTEFGQGNEDLIVVHEALEYGDCRLSIAVSLHYMLIKLLDLIPIHLIAFCN
jgi:ATP phosphoribosyltransferase